MILCEILYFIGIWMREIESVHCSNGTLVDEYFGFYLVIVSFGLFQVRCIYSVLMSSIYFYFEYIYRSDVSILLFDNKIVYCI